LLARRMATHGGGVGSSGNMFHMGGVGSNAGRAACAMARCTRATGIAMDPIEGRQWQTRSQLTRRSRRTRHKAVTTCKGSREITSR
jgi:hypothetical protein